MDASESARSKLRVRGVTSVRLAGVVDADTDPIAINIDSVWQDEPVVVFGSGMTSPDGAGVGTDTARVRSERTGLSDGRVYHIGFTAEDVWGGACSGSVTVCVPHDERPADGCVDQGARYDSTLVVACGFGFELALLLLPILLLYRRRGKFLP